MEDKVRNHNKALEKMLSWEKGIFIDACALECATGREEKALFKTYLQALWRKTKREKEDSLWELMHEHTKNMETHLAHPNLHVIPEVAAEFHKYGAISKSILDRYNDEEERKKWLKPLEILEKAINKNRTRYFPRAIKHTSSINRILEELPKTVQTDSDNPNYTDRRLVSTAFVEAQTSGRDTIVLSYDKGVSQTLQTLSDILENNPQTMMQGGMYDGGPFEVQVVSLRIKSQHPYNTAIIGKSHPLFRKITEESESITD